MKRIFVTLLCAALVTVLTGCSGGEKGEVNVTVAPDTDQSQAETPVGNEPELPEDMPEIGTEATMAPEIDASNYSYTPFALPETGFYMQVPSHWERQPASKSVCFVEPVAEGQVPGRIVVTSKKLEAVTDKTRDSQLRSFFARILGDFDTYEWSDVFTGTSFMGDEDAIWVTYSGTRDGLAYKGYVILGARETTIYVYHFRCGADNYAALEDVIEHVRESIAVEN